MASDNPGAVQIAHDVLAENRDYQLLRMIPGIGPINAALIIGEVGDVSRFPSRDHFASYTGTAPVAASSGDHHRHRLNRAGNRQLNHALYIAAITQIRNDTPGRDYYRSKLAAGKSTDSVGLIMARELAPAIKENLSALAFLLAAKSGLAKDKE
jgi:transposase